MLGFLRLGTGLKAQSKPAIPPAFYYRAIGDNPAKNTGTRAVAVSQTYLPMVNDSGGILDAISIIYKNRVESTSIEFAIADTTTFRCSVEYGGVRTSGYITAGGSNRDLVLPTDTTGRLYVQGLNIPDGALYAIRTWSNSPLGSSPTGIGHNNPINGGTALVYGGSDTTDHTLVGNPVWAAGNGCTPWAVETYKTTNPSRLIGIIGDSIMRGSFTSNISVANLAVKSRGLSFINVGISGMRVNQTVNFVKRLTDLKNAGVTDIIIGYPINDLRNTSPVETLSDIQTASINFWTRIRAAFPNGKLIALTCYGNVIDNSSPGTPNPTPTGAFTGGPLSICSQYNAWLRSVVGTGPQYPTHVHEFADSYQVRDSGLFTNPAQDIQADGLHITSVATTNGAVALAATMASAGL